MTLAFFVLVVAIKCYCSGDAPEGKRSILIIYTGGTIGMEKVNGSYGPKPGFLKEQMDNNPLFQDPRVPNYTFLEFSPLLDSSDIRPDNWILIVQALKENYDKYDGFVVIHGTDTMTYTSSALSYMLKNLRKAVVMTGAQVPMIEPYNDAVSNLLGAMLVAGGSSSKGQIEVIAEVTVFFKGLLLRGNKAVKYSSVDWEGFLVGGLDDNQGMLGKWKNIMNININDILMGINEYNNNNNQVQDDFISIKWQNILPQQCVIKNSFGESQKKRGKCDSFGIYDNVSHNIGMIYIHPGLRAIQIEGILSGLVSGGPDAVILVAPFDGSLPEEKKDLMDVISKYSKSNQSQNGIKRIPVFLVSSCFNNHVKSNTNYEQEYGIIGLHDTTLEAAYAKLCWVMALPDKTLDERIQLMKLNLRGEMSDEPLVNNQSDILTTLLIVLLILCIVVVVLLIILVIVIVVISYHRWGREAKSTQNGNRNSPTTEILHQPTVNSDFYQLQAKA